MDKKIGFIMVITLIGLSLSGCSSSVNSDSNPTIDKQPSATAAPVSVPVTVSKKEEKTAIDWLKPSGGEYPQLRKGEKLWIDASINDQKVYIKDGDQTIYTMVTSSGLDTIPDNSTPKGVYYVEPERGKWFYSNSAKEGAQYFVSWKNHGEFLFHSVPMTKDGKIIEEEARKLGEKASHGCFRLTLQDAKWVYDNIPVKTKVVIRD